MLAERSGLRIHEVPADWTDSPDSRVRIFATAWGDLRGIWRMWWGLRLGTLRLPSLGDVDEAGVSLNVTVEGSAR